VLLLSIPTVVTMVWFIEWWLAPLAALMVAAVVLVLGWGAYHRAVDKKGHHHAKQHVSHQLTTQKSRMRERYRKN
jgi:membrane protein implicated in regulation of membrane protease activity